MNTQTKNTLKITTAAIAGIAMVIGIVWAIIITSPKRLDTPQHWVQEASATGAVAHVTAKGIKVRFEDGKEGFFEGERQFTNGQPVRVHVAVHYAKYYDTPSPPVVELVFRSVYQLP